MIEESIHGISFHFDQVYFNSIILEGFVNIFEKEIS